uniref:PAS domain-containing protein n=1 Tax=Yersinia enterocolitica W22703 TaxID=913028 RepID=F4MZU2_YEREN|nr:hypothetical protein YEW_CB08820 [Yersinia enterocolitica W22703]
MVLRGIDLRGIEIDPIGRIYLNFSQLDFSVFSALMMDIRRIDGVTDVRTVSFMPSEREHRSLRALLESMPEPVFSIDLKGNLELANPAARELFSLNEEKVRHKPRVVCWADIILLVGSMGAKLHLIPNVY